MGRVSIFLTLGALYFFRMVDIGLGLIKGSWCGKEGDILGGFFGMHRWSGMTSESRPSNLPRLMWRLGSIGSAPELILFCST
jgi:hypothetical protein